ncbi:MAG: hypothetical protein GY883_21900 [Shimia sp.]|nr:hypothetical protein [Shimia sp.]
MRRSTLLSLLVAGTFALPATAEDISQWSFGDGENVMWGDIENFRSRIFETFDLDGDGALNTDEYTAFDKARAEAANNSQSSIVLRAVAGMSRSNIDSNLDGLVTRSEMDTALRAWFASKDKDGDGILIKGTF